MNSEQNLNNAETQALNIPVISRMLLDEATQNECWFQIVNIVEDMSNNLTWDEVIELLKTQYMIVPRNYR